MKIALGIPTNRGVKAKTVRSLLELVAKSTHEFVVILATEGYTVSENRNYIMIQALKNDCQWLLFVDDDMTFPSDTLDKLLSLGKDIVGVASNSRMLPLKHTVELPSDVTELPKEPFLAKAVGCGVMLVNLEVVKKIPQPWFQMETFVSGMTARGEDAWFCDRARDMGIEIWCDPTIKVGHIGDYEY